MKTVIFKAIETCNSNCIYCDVIRRGATSSMPQHILETVFKRLNVYLLEFPKEEILFIWHGGEPCLLGVDYFKKALEFQQKHCPETKGRIKHEIQTNLTAISQELIDVFKEMGITTIGTSFEPIHGMRGPGKNRDSVAYNRNFFKGVNLLEKNDISWGVIYVVNKRSMGRAKELFYFLENLNLGHGTCYNVVKIFDQDEHNLAISVDEYVDWLGEVFTEWYPNRERYPSVMPFTSIMATLEGKGMVLGCEDSGSCAYGWLYVGPTGKLSHCGRAGDYDMLNYGNIEEKSITEILNDPQREVLAHRNEALINTYCKDCRFWRICHGGCPLDAYMTNRDFHTRYPMCGAKPKLFEKYIEPVTGLIVDFSLKPNDIQENTQVDHLKATSDA